MLTRIDHVGLVAASFEDALVLLQEQLGLVLDEQRSPLPDGVYFEPEKTNAYFFMAGRGETRVELLIPTPDAASGTARFLARNGPGLHHLGFACDDVEAEAERLRESGLKEIQLPRTADGRRTVAFFHPASAGGVLTELVPSEFGDALVEV